MKAIFDKINIESIQFESGINEVHVSCNITQGSQTFRSELVLDYSDLNLLIGRIQQLSDMDLLNHFDKVDLQDGHSWYSLESGKAGIGHLWIEEMEFSHPLRQIRA